MEYSCTFYWLSCKYRSNETDGWKVYNKGQVLNTKPPTWPEADVSARAVLMFREFLLSSSHRSPPWFRPLRRQRVRGKARNRPVLRRLPNSAGRLWAWLVRFADFLAYRPDSFQPVIVLKPGKRHHSIVQKDVISVALLMPCSSFTANSYPALFGYESTMGFY
jgi:hypothetical protein